MRRLRDDIIRAGVRGGTPGSGAAARTVLQWHGWRRLSGTLLTGNAVPLGECEGRSSLHYNINIFFLSSPVSILTPSAERASPKQGVKIFFLVFVLVIFR